MLDPDTVPDVADDEVLARFLLVKGFIRGDGTLKHNELMPPPSGKLSVMRHRSATQDEIWAEGREVSRLRARNLLGRAELVAGVCRAEGLQVIKSPLQADPASKPEPRRRLANPNHADLVFPPPAAADAGIPPAKADQMAIAKALVAHRVQAIPPPVDLGESPRAAD